MSNKKYCIDCKWHRKGKEYVIASRYLFPDQDDKIPGFLMCSSGTEALTACQHPVCFEDVEVDDPIIGPHTVTSRIQGNAQLNKDLDCPYFKPRRPWWMFWKRA